MAREGHYGKVIRALESNGIATPGDAVALQDLLKKHPAARSEVQRCITAAAALTVDAAQVKKVVQSFPKGPTPGWFQLRVQHLFDVICGCTGPSAQDCLVELTKWLNLLLSGKAHPSLAPWLGGAQLTALHKRTNVVLGLLLLVTPFAGWPVNCVALQYIPKLQSSCSPLASWGWG